MKKKNMQTLVKTKTHASTIVVMTIAVLAIILSGAALLNAIMSMPNTQLTAVANKTDIYSAVNMWKGQVDVVTVYKNLATKKLCVVTNRPYETKVNCTNLSSATWQDNGSTGTLTQNGQATKFKYIASQNNLSLSASALTSNNVYVGNLPGKFYDSNQQSVDMKFPTVVFFPAGSNKAIIIDSQAISAADYSFNNNIISINTITSFSNFQNPADKTATSVLAYTQKVINRNIELTSIGNGDVLGWKDGSIQYYFNKFNGNTSSLTGLPWANISTKATQIVDAITTQAKDRYSPLRSLTYYTYAFADLTTLKNTGWTLYSLADLLSRANTASYSTQNINTRLDEIMDIQQSWVSYNGQTAVVQGNGVTPGRGTIGGGTGGLTSGRNPDGSVAGAAGLIAGQGNTTGQTPAEIAQGKLNDAGFGSAWGFISQLHGGAGMSMGGGLGSQGNSPINAGKMDSIGNKIMAGFMKGIAQGGTTFSFEFTLDSFTGKVGGKTVYTYKIPQKDTTTTAEDDTTTTNIDSKYLPNQSTVEKNSTVKPSPIKPEGSSAAPDDNGIGGGMPNPKADTDALTVNDGGGGPITPYGMGINNEGLSPAPDEGPGGPISPIGLAGMYDPVDSGPSRPNPRASYGDLIYSGLVQRSVTNGVSANGTGSSTATVGLDINGLFTTNTATSK